MINYPAAGSYPQTLMTLCLYVVDSCGTIHQPLWGGAQSGIMVCNYMFSQVLSPLFYYCLSFWQILRPPAELGLRRYTSTPANHWPTVWTRSADWKKMNQHCEYLIVSLKKPNMVSWNIQYYNISKYSYTTNTHTQVELCSYCCKAAGRTTPPSCGSFSIDPWTDFHWRFVVVGF